MSKERPISFSAPMVKAILEGRKTQTRRVVKAKELLEFKDRYGSVGSIKQGDDGFIYEAVSEKPVNNHYRYSKAFECPYGIAKTNNWGGDLLRVNSRITLEITNVRVEWLQDISEADAIAEGSEYVNGGEIWNSGYRHDPYGSVHDTARGSFCCLWDSINGKKYSWADNPWVWVVEFKLLDNIEPGG